MLSLTAVLFLPLVLSKSLKYPEFTKDGKFYNLVSTMTPYDDVRGDIPEVKDCKPEAIWSFLRHGTRFPHLDEITEFSNLTHIRDLILEHHAQSRGELSKKELENLRSWEFIAEKEEDMMLTISGVHELYHLGKRLRHAFKSLIEKIPTKDIQVKISSKLRTRQSAEALTLGLLESYLRLDSRAVDNELIKNEKQCPSWKQNTKSPKAKEELEKFKNTDEFKSLVSRLTKRLGFEDELSYDMIQDMYDVCGFEYSWYHDAKQSPWCSLFTEKDMKLMEYAEDLSYFYKSGYGNKVVSYLGDKMVNDAISKLSQKEPKVTLLFGHSSGIRKLLVSLGIGKQEPLTGDGYAEAKQRNWRTSILSPFAANIMAVRYKCKKGPKDAVGVFVNEWLVSQPLCDNKKLCPLEDFARAFSKPDDPSVCALNNTSS